MGASKASIPDQLRELATLVEFGAVDRFVFLWQDKNTAVFIGPAKLEDCEALREILKRRIQMARHKARAAGREALDGSDG